MKGRRPYDNAFLQGPFRNSAVDCSSDAIETLIIETRIGITYVVRAQAQLRRPLPEYRAKRTAGQPALS